MIEGSSNTDRATLKMVGFVIRASEADKNDQGDIVIPYGAGEFSGKPMVYVTPQYGPGSVSAIPTVVKVGESHITIRDENAEAVRSGNYYLHVLLVDPEQKDPGLLPRNEAKNQPGPLSVDVDEYKRPGFLTPFMNGGPSVTSVETINRKTTAGGYWGTYANSENVGPDYSVNYLAVRAGYGNLLTGTVAKTEREVDVTFPFGPLKHDPCVILTPSYDHETKVAHELEVSSATSRSGFTIASDSVGVNLEVNWLAVPQDIPRLSAEHLHAGIDHLASHFPNHRADIDTHRAELENIILRGVEPSKALKAHTNEFTPSFPKTRAAPSEKAVAVARVAFDAFALVAGMFTTVRLAKTNVAIQAMAATLEEGGALSAVSEGASAVAADLFQSVASLSATAEKLLDFLKGLAIAGMLRSLFVAFYEQLNLGWYGWIVTSVTILSQILAMTVAAPLAAAAWVLRIVALLGSAATLVLDAEALWHLDHAG